MKKFITKCFALLVTLVSVAVMTGTASAQTIAKPPGARLVLVSECRIDFESSVSWTGSSEDTVIQIFWLISQLPEECLEHNCVFTNIDPDWFLFLIPRFLEEFEYDPRLQELGSLVITAFQDCRIAANPAESLSSTTGSISCGSDGNTLILSVSGSNSVFSALQIGCNVANFDLRGNNIRVMYRAIGRNTAVVRIDSSDVVFTLDQNGQHTYNSTITTPGAYHAHQSGN